MTCPEYVSCCLQAVNALRAHAGPQGPGGGRPGGPGRGRRNNGGGLGRAGWEERLAARDAATGYTQVGKGRITMVSKFPRMLVGSSGNANAPGRWKAL